MSLFWQKDEIWSPSLLWRVVRVGVYGEFYSFSVCIFVWVFPWGYSCSNDLLNVKWTVVGRKHHAGALAGSSLAFHALIVRQLLWSAHSTEAAACPENICPRITCTHPRSLKAPYSPLYMDTNKWTHRHPFSHSGVTWSGHHEPEWMWTWPHTLSDSTVCSTFSIVATKCWALSRHWQLLSRKEHKPSAQ